jgi:hypothetical protein
MARIEEFVIQFTVFLVGLLSIGIGRIVGALQHDFDQILSNLLIFGGLLVIICLFVTIILTWRRNSAPKM